MIKLLKFGIAIMVMFIMVSCDKGDKGEQGPQGDDGNTNVKTTIVTVEPGDWSGSSIVSAEKNLDIITDEIAEFGAIFVYLKIGDKMYKPLPYTWPSGGETVIYRFKTQPQKIKFEIYSSGTTQIPTSDRVYKVVAMEASEYDYAKRKLNINFNDYNQVAEFANTIEEKN